jgi:hypothetical protein
LCVPHPRAQSEIVEDFIRAYYLPDEELETWIEEHCKVPPFSSILLVVKPSLASPSLPSNMLFQSSHVSQSYSRAQLQSLINVASTPRRNKKKLLDLVEELRGVS